MLMPLISKKTMRDFSDVKEGGNINPNVVWIRVSEFS
jgi:hypothetical protein